MTTAQRNRLLIGGALGLAAAAIAVQMFFSLTPPRHADHDHAIASLDAGGFIFVELLDGGRRNLVGRPGRVLVTHWFDPAAATSAEAGRAAAFAAAAGADADFELLLIADAASQSDAKTWAEQSGVATSLVYRDPDGRAAELCGVRRQPETLVFDPGGRLAFQARGATAWTPSGIGAQIERAKAGVEEIH